MSPLQELIFESIVTPTFKLVQLYHLVFPNQTTLSHLQTPYDVTPAEIAHKEQIPPFASMFSTLFNNNSFIYREIPYICLVAFKIGVCCRFSVCRKELKDHIR